MLILKAAKAHIRAENERLILEAGERIFAQHGFRGSTMQMIADQAGLPKANLHYYFDSKEKLYRCVVEKIFEIWLQAASSFENSDEPKEALKLYIYEKMQISRRHPYGSKVWANEVMQEGEKRLEQVEKFEKSLQRQSAEQELLKYHPDFVEIRQDQKFHDWVSEQPSAIQDSVYKNNTDVRWAARTIDLYKIDTGKRKTSNKSAAEAVGRTSSSAPKTTEKAIFSESVVQAMSDAEYEANEEAITAAIQAGNFSYDISGAAR